MIPLVLGLVLLVLIGLLRSVVAPVVLLATVSGLVLAATFATLGVLPLVFFATVGFSVAFGVLLDTLLVRSVLVPGLALLLGDAFWWPGRLRRRPAGAPVTSTQHETVHLIRDRA